ncbi:MAG TPA: EamA family transporter [candidate division Zixibacteria bacterium]|nr:EamA family transporter [candidate division Zixibacteria bacterium]
MTPEAIALLAALSYALFTVFGWFGLRYSTPIVATVVSLTARTATLWTAVFVTGGIPRFATPALVVFVVLGVLQSATSLLTFIGLHKVGTARSQPLRNTYPLWSAAIAVLVMGERAGGMILAGTALIVVGVVLISWKPQAPPPGYRWWHVLYSLAAGALAGIAFPLRRLGLTITNEPVFFAAVVAVVSLIGAVPYCAGARDRRAPWDRRGVLHFSASGFFEALGALLSLIALASGRVVVVAPIVATTPLWNLLIAMIFLRGREEINPRTVAGTVAVVLGTVAVAAGR